MKEMRLEDICDTCLKLDIMNKHGGDFVDFTQEKLKNSVKKISEQAQVLAKQKSKNHIEKQMAELLYNIFSIAQHYELDIVGALEDNINKKIMGVKF